MNVLICGLPGSGKTTFGSQLAKQIDRPFCDTDDLVQVAYRKKTGRVWPCRQIFREIGIGAFREMEKEVILSLSEDSKWVIALGGGTILIPEVAPALPKLGLLVYLKIDPEDALERLVARGLPATLDQNDFRGSFFKMVKERVPLYEKYSQVTIDMKSGTLVK